MNVFCLSCQCVIIRLSMLRILGACGVVRNSTERCHVHLTSSPRGHLLTEASYTITVGAPTLEQSPVSTRWLWFYTLCVCVCACSSVTLHHMCMSAHPPPPPPRHRNSRRSRIPQFPFDNHTFLLPTQNTLFFLTCSKLN